MPPHSILKLLFSLKYLHGITNEAVLAREIGCTEKAIKIIDKELRALLKAKIGVITRDRLEFVCPECLNARVYQDPERGERVCGSCGTVLEPLPTEFDESLPFDTTYALESQLAYDKSLGGTLNGKALMRVLAQSPATKAAIQQNGNPDLGIRARMIKVIAGSQEPPALKRALVRAAAYSRFYGLEGDKIFNHDLGRNVRRAYWFASMVREGGFEKRLAETAFWYTLCLHGKKAQALAFHRDYDGHVNRKLFVALVDLNKFLQNLKKKSDVVYELSVAENIPTF